MSRFFKLCLFFGFAGTLVAAKKVGKDPDMVIRDEMVVISRQLGVTCTHCHDPQNFKSGAKTEFHIAAQHMRVVKYLNSPQGFNGKPKVDCYMCHRGEAKPPFREPETAATSGRLQNAAGAH